MAALGLGVLLPSGLSMSQSRRCSTSSLAARLRPGCHTAITCSSTAASTSCVAASFLPVRRVHRYFSPAAGDATATASANADASKWRDHRTQSQALILAVFWRKLEQAPAEQVVHVDVDARLRDVEGREHQPPGAVVAVRRRRGGGAAALAAAKAGAALRAAALAEDGCHCGGTSQGSERGRRKQCTLSRAAPGQGSC
jgi:hypothetical protein